jgi:hypothetical protein
MVRLIDDMLDVTRIHVTPVDSPALFDLQAMLGRVVGNEPSGTGHQTSLPYMPTAGDRLLLG